MEFIFFDQAGTGCSSEYPSLDLNDLPNWQSFGSTGIADDLETLRSKLKLGTKLNIFGHSFGAKVALRFATRYPHSVQSVFIYGDSFAPEEKDIVNDLISTRKKQIEFFEKRLSETQIGEVLKSLKKNEKDFPCASDTHGFIKVCGFDLVADLGHYYSHSTAPKIEALLNRLNNHVSSSEAFRELTQTYSLYKLDPQAIVLYFLDYRLLVKENKIACELTEAALPIPNWYLNSCAINKHWLPFLNHLRANLKSDLLNEASIKETLHLNPQIHLYQLVSQSDMLNSNPVRKQELSNWTIHDLHDSDHTDFYKSSEFWSILLKAKKTSKK